MIEVLKKAIENESEEELIKYLDFRHKNKIDQTHFGLIVNVLQESWHCQHEDLVNTIYLSSLKDDRFVDPILKIALNRNDYRKHDDELESTLRKCVHALKVIDSKSSKIALDRLKKLNNINVQFILDIYK